MKQKLTRGVRKVLPARTTGVVEEIYRKNRARMVAMKYGNPARHLKVIAITGTNGKTTTLNFLNEILKEAGKKTAMFSTATIEVDGQSRRNDLNMTVGSVSQMQAFFAEARRAHVDYVLLEAASHALQQHKLDNIPIEVAIMTNLTQDHLDYHKTMAEYARVKATLFERSPRYIVLNRDDEWFDYFDAYRATSQKITYGKHEQAEARIEGVKLYRRGTEVRLTIDHQTKLELATALPGEFNAYNLTAAAAAAYLLGIKLRDIVEGVANLEEVPGRFERPVEGQKLPYDIIVDYAHTPDGLEKLLTAARELTKNRVILVFGACGDRDKSKRPLMGEIAAQLADRIIITDEENYTEDAAAIRRDVKEGVESAKGGAIKSLEIPDRQRAIEKAMDIAKKDDTILITGLGHEVYRIIDGERVAWNDGDVVRAIVKERMAKK